MAGACAEAAIKRRAKPIVRHQQTRRSLFTHVDDPRRSRRSWESRGQAGSAKPLARWPSAASASERRRCGARQQECSYRLGNAGRECLLRTGAIRSGSLMRANRRRTRGSLTWQLQPMTGDGETVTPSLPEPGVWTGMAQANVLAPLRWKRAKIHRGSRRRIVGPHQEAGYTSAVVTVARIQSECCNRAGSIYVTHGTSRQPPQRGWMSEIGG